MNRMNVLVKSVMLGMLLALPARGATFTVNSTVDPGDGVCDATECTLREAIAAANGNPGMDTIAFNIPGTGPHTIKPISGLPATTDPVIIDGYTQAGAIANINPVGQGLSTVLKIELNGIDSGNFTSGLIIMGGNSTVRGLVINRFLQGTGEAHGIALRSNGNRVEGNFVGTDDTGTVLLANGASGVQVRGSSDNVIGGTTPAARNLIAGGTAPGGSVRGITIVNFGGGVASDNVVQGNLIGTDITGTMALGSLVGISDQGGDDPGNTSLIGGTDPGAGNVISGNLLGGIVVLAGVAQGNIIGLDVTGRVALGNGGNGISAFGGSVVGGSAPGARNIISANGTGVNVSSSGVVVQGNFIGTDITGTVDLGNGTGVGGGGTNNLIGGTGPGEGNLISGNGNGLAFGSAATGMLVQGNLIGTDVTGTAPLGNSNGIAIGVQNNTIGGTAPGAGNVISCNSEGIRIGGNGGNVIEGNFIGTDVNGTLDLGNSTFGVLIGLFSPCPDNKIGGTAAGTGNIIAFNGDRGVAVVQGAGNAILSNSIFSNGRLGIDLDEDGRTPPLGGAIDDVTPNDAGDVDGDVVPVANNLQNFPVLSSAIVDSGTTTVDGTLNSKPNTDFTLEFFSNSGCAPADCEGETFLATTVVTTDASGDAPFAFGVPASVPVGDFITVTATDPAGNTSEFSQTAEVTPPTNVAPSIACAGAVELWSPDHSLVDVSSAFSVLDEDGDPLTVTIRVLSDETEVPETGDGTGRHHPDFKNELFPGGRGLLVRSERRGTEDGRFYLFVITVDDGNGGVTTAVCTAAACPHDQNEESLAEVLLQADLAKADVEAAIAADGVENLDPAALGLAEHGLSGAGGPFQ